MFALEFKTGNAAFGEDEGEMRAEIARILKEITAHVERGGHLDAPIRIGDYNGNKVGEFKLLGKYGIGEDVRW
jgi:hypothetical protein